MADRDAFEALVLRHERAVRSFIAGLGVPLDVVDDLAQEVFVDRYQQSQRPDGTEAAWLKAMARNKVRAWFRRHGRQRRLLQEYAGQLDRLPPPPGFEGGADDLLDQLAVCLQRLPGRQRDLLCRYYDADEDPAGLAAGIGRGLSALRMQMLKLREVLRRCIEQRQREAP